MGWMECTASADAAPNPHVCEHEQSGNAAAGCSIHPAALSDYQQPFQVPDGVQGEKHCTPALFKCHPCCQASLVHSSSPNQRWWILGSCRVLGGGEINAQSGVPATWLLHLTHRVGREGDACCGPGWPRVLAARSRSA